MFVGNGWIHNFFLKKLNIIVQTIFRVVSKPKKSRKTQRAPQPPKLKTRAPPPPPPPPATKKYLGFSEIMLVSMFKCWVKSCPVSESKLC